MKKWKVSGLVSWGWDGIASCWAHSVYASFVVSADSELQARRAVFSLFAARPDCAWDFKWAGIAGRDVEPA